MLPTTGYFESGSIQLHTAPLTVLYAVLKTDPKNGLHQDEALKRLIKQGKNQHITPIYTPIWRKFFNNLFVGFLPVVWLTALFCILLYMTELILRAHAHVDNLIPGVLLLLIIFITTSVYYIQDYEDYSVMEYYKHLNPLYCVVMRGGLKRIVLCENLVKGDIVYVEMGDHVPADLRIIQSNNLCIDCVLLTGRSEPLALYPHIIDEHILHTRNVAFSGSIVVNGSGFGVVIGCGAESIVAIFAALSCSKKPKSSVRKHFKGITFFSFCVCGFLIAILLLIMLFGKLNWKEIFIMMIGLSAGSVPIIFEISSFIGIFNSAKRLEKKNCKVLNLEATETIGSVTVVAFNMLGTVTMEKHSVTEVYMDNKLYTTADMIHWSLDDRPTTFSVLCRCAMLCSYAKIKSGMSGVPKELKDISGDAYERACLKFINKYYSDISFEYTKYPTIAQKQYNKVTRYQISLHKMINEFGEISFLVLVKGHCVTILRHCTKILLNGVDCELDSKMKSEIRKTYAYLLEQGRSIFGFCDFVTADTSLKLVINNMKEMRFLGLMAVFDPPHPKALNAVRQFRKAGIKIIFFTQLNTNIALNIGKEIGLLRDQNETDDDIAQRLKIKVLEIHPNFSTAAVVNCHGMQANNFSRVIKSILLTHSDIIFIASAVQCYEIIACCQELGAVVAVYGQNMIQAPLMRRADVSIVKGIAGSIPAKKCADMILLDDNLITIAEAVAEGRLLFENMKKSLAYLLASNLPQIIGYCSFLFLRIPVPFSIFVAIYIDLVIGLLPSITFYFEPDEDDVMKMKPIHGGEYLINRKILFVVTTTTGVFCTAAGLLSYFIIMARNGFHPASLIGRSEEWMEPSKNDLVDSYGQEWTYYERQILQKKVGSGFLISITIMQSVNLILCKTNRVSLITQGFQNFLLNIASVVIIVCSVFLSEIDDQEILHLASLSTGWWLYIVPLALELFAMETARRYVIRKLPQGWLERETCY